MILATIKQFNQKQLILVQGEDSQKGHLIYLTWKGSFQVILYKIIRFLSGKLKKHTKLAKIVKISIFVNRLVFPMNFNRFSHPMTHAKQVYHFYIMQDSQNKVLTVWKSLPNPFRNGIQVADGAHRNGGKGKLYKPKCYTGLVWYPW